MGQTITLFAALWTLSVLPPLCTSGLLVHPCDCDSPSGCSHETECLDDPCCAVVIVRLESSPRASGLPDLTAAPLDDAPTLPADDRLRLPNHRHSQPVRRGNRTYADSDIPLLI